MSKTQMDLVTLAIQFCVCALKGRTRKNGTPWYTHNLGMVGILIEVCPDYPKTAEGQEILAAAVLHNLVAMGDVSLDTIEAHFGASVASIINELTDLPLAGDTYEAMTTRLVERARKSSSDAARVIMFADRYLSLMTLPNGDLHETSLSIQRSRRIIEAIGPANFPDLYRKAVDKIREVTGSRAWDFGYRTREEIFGPPAASA